MPIQGTILRFQKPEILLIPESQGVYALFDGNELIYYGRATGEGGLRSRLQEHFAGRGGPCTQKATGFTFESCDDPPFREAFYQAEFEVKYGRLPRCNK